MIQVEPPSSHNHNKSSCVLLCNIAEPKLFIFGSGSTFVPFILVPATAPGISYILYTCKLYTYKVYTDILYTYILYTYILYTYILYTYIIYTDLLYTDKLYTLTSAMQLIYCLNIRGFYRKYIWGFSI